MGLRDGLARLGNKAVDVGKNVAIGAINPPLYTALKIRDATTPNIQPVTPKPPRPHNTAVSMGYTPVGTAQPYTPADRTVQPYTPAGTAQPYTPAGTAQPYTPAGTAQPYTPEGTGKPYTPVGTVQPYTPASTGYTPVGTLQPYTPADRTLQQYTPTTSYNPQYDETGLNPNNPAYYDMKKREEDLKNGIPLTYDPKEKYDEFELSQRQAAESQASADKALFANRPTEITPSGQKKWSQDPVTGEWTATTTLNEDLQEVFDKNTDWLKNTGDMRADATDAAKDALSTPFQIPGDAPTYTGPEGDMPTLGTTKPEDLPTYSATDTPIPEYSGVTTPTPEYVAPTSDIPKGDITKGLGAFESYQAPTGPMPTTPTPDQNTPTLDKPAGDVPAFNAPEGQAPTFEGMEGGVPQFEEIKQNVMDSLLARSEEDIGEARQRKHAQLIAQGIPPGSEAYIDEMQQIDRQQTDARQQAEITASQIASTEYQNRLAGRKQEQSEAGQQFNADVISRNINFGESKDKFLADMQSRGMSFDEATQIYDREMDKRDTLFNEGKDVFTAEMQKRGMTLEEANIAFDNQIKQRDQITQENIQQFSADVQTRGMESQESQRLFDNAIVSYGMDVEKTKAKYDGDVQSYMMNRQKGLDKFAADMEKYGIERAEAVQMFDSEMIKRGMESEEDLTKFNTDMQTHRQEIANALLERNQPLNEMQILSGGQQISVPQFLSGGSAVTTPGADYTGVSQFQQTKDVQIQQMLNNLQIAINNGEQAKANNIMSGLFGLGSALIMS